MTVRVRPARAAWAAALLAAAPAFGCTALLGIKDEYTTEHALEDAGATREAAAQPDAPSTNDASGECVGGAGLGVLGERCCTPNSLACAGHGQKLKLVCAGGVWAPNGTCDGELLCSTTVDPGTCKVRDPKCIGRKADEPFCIPADANLYVCDADLISPSTERCTSYEHCVAHLGKACAVCLPAEHKCTADTLHVCAPDRLSFVIKESCPTGQCRASGNCEGKLCNTGQFHCNGTMLQQCSTDRMSWEDVASCAFCQEGVGQCLQCPPNTSLGCRVEPSGIHFQKRCALDGLSQYDFQCPAYALYCAPGSFACVACLSDTHCSSLDTVCAKGVCAANTCSTVPANEGLVINQTERDCTQTVCMGGKETQRLLAPGTPCGSGRDEYCDAAGACVFVN